MFRIFCGTEKDVKAKEKSLQAPSRNFKNYLSFGNVNPIKYVIVTNVVFVRGWSPNFVFNIKRIN